jgi:hypothetical protein
MTATYALLVEPSFNRVYTQQAPAVLAAELAVVDELVLGGVVVETRRVDRGGAPFLELTVRDELAPDALVVLAGLSSTYVLFEVRDGAYHPVDVEPVACYDDDLLTTLRYSGKTNEQFTELLVNLAVAASAAASERRLAGERVRLLDPLAGRGTTLNQGIMSGFDVTGIEVDQRDTDAYAQFLETWLKDKRIKHRVQTYTYRKGRPVTAHEAIITIKRSVMGDATDQVVDIIHDDTLLAREHLKRSSVDVIVGDLPYGIQHGARTDLWGSSRNATTLLTDALPVWRSVLRGGGALCLAWNTRTLPRADLVGLLDEAGLDVLHRDGAGFEHRVDRSITRDVVLATKPRS